MTYDLIIVGGGPGGATAAKIASEHNANVLLLEAAEEGRYKCCAGGVPIRNEEFSPIITHLTHRILFKSKILFYFFIHRIENR